MPLMIRHRVSLLLILGGVAAAGFPAMPGNRGIVTAAGQVPPSPPSLPIKIGSQIAGSFVDSTGHSGQSHLVYAANAGVWWLFTLTSAADSPGGSNHIVKAYRSSGPDLASAVWTAAADSPGASASTGGSMGSGRALGVVYINNAPTDIVHAEVAMAFDGQDGATGHIRARLTATGITWETWNHFVEGAATWTTPRAVVLGLSTGKYIHSGGPTLQQEVDANARRSNNPDTGTAWTSGFSSVAVIDNSMINASNAIAFAPLANNVMLATYDNGGGVSTCYNCGQTGEPEPRLTNLGYKKSNASGAWPTVPVGTQAPGDGQVFSTSAAIDQNDWTLVPLNTTTIRAYRRNAGGTGIDAAAYNTAANTWSSAPAPPPFGAGRAFKNGAGLFGAHDATTTWLFIVNTDAANSILYSRYDGTTWSSWAAVPGTDSGTHARRFISGAPVLAAGQIGLIWTEGTSPYDVFSTSLATTQGPVPPTATFSVSPTLISSGQAATLTWNVINATTVSINQAIGTVAASGTRSVTPTATTTYTLTATNTAGSVTATATVTVASTGTTPTITWNNPASIIYGTVLSGTQLNASTTVPGSWAYSPAAGTLLAAGAARTLSVTFTPTDTVTYTSATDTVTIAVLKATPLITWPAPASIASGTPLSGSQLNATANVAGAFVYTPPSGTVLGVGAGQTLSVTFTPTAIANYNTATRTVQITVTGTPTTGHNAARANAYDDAWQGGSNGWVENAKAILAGGTGQTVGLVLWIGDSLTRDAALGTWAQRGAGKTAEDQAITAWMHAGLSPQSIDSIDGFALATPYFCSARSYTVGDGLGAWHFMGSSSMPADTDPATARQKLQNCTAYPNALNLTTMLAALPKAQFAIPEVNLEAGNPAVFTDLERMIDLMISKGIVPIILTYTYRTDAAFNLLVDRYNTSLVAYAQAKKLPLIDLNKEMLARLPFAQWPGRFLSDGVHYTRGNTTYPSTSDPYANGGDPATHTTGLALTYNGYGLKGWLGVQKMKEITQLVIDGVPPALPTVALSATTVAAGTTVTATIANGPGNAGDWVALYSAGAADGQYVDWKYLNGTRTRPGSGATGAAVAFTMPATPGTYNVRFFLNDSWVKLATSATITVTATAPPTLTLSATTILPGGTVTATIVNGPGNAGDWLGLLGASAADGAYVAWKYLNGTQFRPASGVTGAAVAFTMPATPGAYNVRFFLNDSWAKLATSATITVTAPAPPTVTLSATTVVPGGTVTATIANGPANAGDWLGLVTANAADPTYVDWKYLNGTRTKPGTGLSGASVTFALPAAPGTYNVRFFLNDSWVKLATSATITVQ
jgi:hypothetical protein